MRPNREMMIPNNRLWLRAALVVALAVFPAAVHAISVDSSSRTLQVNGPKQPLQATSASRTSPGAFSNTVTIGDSNSSTSASQDSALTQTATLIHISGNGSTSADRFASSPNSIQQLADSFFDTNFSLLNNSPYTLSGILAVEGAVPLGGSGPFDTSFASIQLNELNGATIFAASSKGSFNDSGVLPGGKTYHLRIESKVFLQTNEAFSKANDWSINFIASDVPEPGAGVLILFAALAFCAGRRRADGAERTGL